MQLPQKIIPYAVGVLRTPKNITTTFLAKIVNKTHDYLTRSLKEKYYWKRTFKEVLSKYDLTKGYYVIDDTEENKIFSKSIFGSGWLYSHLEKRYVYGFQIVLLCWTDGKVKIPVAWKFYQLYKDKKNRKTKLVLSSELIDYALNNVERNVKGIIFDSFYSSEKLLKKISNLKLKFYSQVDKTRCINNTQARRYRNLPYWSDRGKLKGGIDILMTKHRKKYFITNDLNISGKQLRETYSIRWKIEEIFRFCKNQLNLEGCQMRDLTSQNNNLAISLILFCLIQDKAEEKQMTNYAIKEEASFQTNNDTLLISFNLYGFA